MFKSKFIVRKHERGLLFRDGDFLRFLAPGEYRFWNLRKRYTVQRFDIAQPRFEHPLKDYLLQAERVAVDALFTVVETGGREAAIVYHNERPADAVGPAQCRLYWQGVVRTRVERFDIGRSIVVEPRLARQLCADAPQCGFEDGILLATVPHGHVGLLTVDGENADTLSAGVHAFWRFEHAVKVDLVDVRVRTLEVQGQEILTRDKVSLRINLTATYRFEDAAKAFGTAKDPLDHLYKEIQFGLRAAVGTRTLDALLEDKTAIDRAVADHLGTRFADLGLDVRSVGVKDIVLPGDMKQLLGQVVEAEKAAQANVIRRREETNATRSLLNTAKVMESNAVALRLKELETLEKVTDKVGNLSVYGGLDGLLNELVRLKA